MQIILNAGMIINTVETGLKPVSTNSMIRFQLFFKEVSHETE
jgi:hypothetical protein